AGQQAAAVSAVGRWPVEDEPQQDERLRQQCREHDSGSQPGTAHEGEKTRRRHYLAHVFPPEFASQNEGVRRFRYRHIANIVRSRAVVNLGSKLTFTPTLYAGHACPAHPEASVSQDRSSGEYVPGQTAVISLSAVVS